MADFNANEDKLQLQNPVVRLMQRPKDFPVDGEHLVYGVEELVVAPNSLQEGQFLVKNIYLGLDPAARTWMDFDKKSYLPPVEIGDIMRGATVGEVVVSRSSKFMAGDIVNCYMDGGGWCGYAVVNDSSSVERLSPAAGIPLKAYLGVLGGTGLTAYFGLIHVGQPKEGDTVVVSAAGGATGSIVCQIAKHVFGCKVIGIAGGAQKCAWLLNTVGIDAAVDYKRGTQADFESDLKAALGGGGIDIFFDSVGGWILDKTLKRINYKARVVLCGAISSYNSKSKGLPPGPGNYLNLITKSARMEGFILFNYAEHYAKAKEDIISWIRKGQITYLEDVVTGLDQAAQALLKLFGQQGGNKGKLIVQIFPQSQL